jgi:ubiquitin C-terminal hydrolase
MAAFDIKEVRNHVVNIVNHAIKLFNTNSKEDAEEILKRYIDKQNYLNDVEQNKLNPEKIWENYIAPLKKEIYQLKNNITNLEDGDDTNKL